MRRRGKIDSNQREIVRALEKAGCSVVSLSNIGNGVCDLLVGRADRNYLLEVKVGNETLTPEQEKFFLLWQGQRTIVRNVTDALYAVGLIGERQCETGKRATC